MDSDRSTFAFHPGDQKTALALADKTGQQTVRCDQRDTDRYGRAVAVCRIGAEDLGAWLALEGWALAYQEFSGDYVWAEDTAKKARKGVWAGEFEAPWDWRRTNQR